MKPGKELDEAVCSLLERKPPIMADTKEMFDLGTAVYNWNPKDPSQY